MMKQTHLVKFGHGDVPAVKLKIDSADFLQAYPNEDILSILGEKVRIHEEMHLFRALMHKLESHELAIAWGSVLQAGAFPHEAGKVNLGRFATVSWSGGLNGTTGRQRISFSTSDLLKECLLAGYVPEEINHCHRLKDGRRTRLKGGVRSTEGLGLSGEEENIWGPVVDARAERILTYLRELDLIGAVLSKLSPEEFFIALMEQMRRAGFSTKTDVLHFGPLTLKWNRRTKPNDRRPLISVSLARGAKKAIAKNGLLPFLLAA